MTKLTHKNRPNNKIDYCRGIAVGLKLMYEDGHTESELLQFAKYLFPDIDQNEGELEHFIHCVVNNLYYDPTNKDSKKPTKDTHGEFYDLLIDEFNIYAA